MLFLFFYLDILLSYLRLPFLNFTMLYLCKAKKVSFLEVFLLGLLLLVYEKTRGIAILLSYILYYFFAHFLLKKENTFLKIFFSFTIGFIIPAIIYHPFPFPTMCISYLGGLVLYSLFYILVPTHHKELKIT